MTKTGQNNKKGEDISTSEKSDKGRNERNTKMVSEKTKDDMTSNCHLQLIEKEEKRSSGTEMQGMEGINSQGKEGKLEQNNKIQKCVRIICK